jgi:Raf kinase inhibitor-like YbhB/YbcL family protein
VTRNRRSMSLIAASAALLAAFALSAATDGYAQSTAQDTQPQFVRPVDGPPNSGPSPSTPPAVNFVLSSPDFTDDGTMHRRQVNERCGGEDISPALQWRNPPAGTKSFALLMHDPDAPQAEGFWHWIVYAIPASVSSLPAGAGDEGKKLLPAGAIQGRSNFGTVGYGGPCPPPGRPHSYYFRLYALPVARLNVPPDATATIIASYADASSLGRAQIVARYGR